MIFALWKRSGIVYSHASGTLEAGIEVASVRLRASKVQHAGPTHHPLRVDHDTYDTYSIIHVKPFIM